MTRAELDERLTVYTRHAKQTIVVFWIGFAILAVLIAFAPLIFPSRLLTPSLFIAFGWLVLLISGIVVWRRIVYILAQYHGLICPFCRRNVLGNPAEHVLKSAGRCLFCSSQIVSDVTQKA
jgi:predicted ABC-type exoprotein transport system permease subunit